MVAYVIANVEVLDPDRYRQYSALAGPAIAKHGGRFLVRGGAAEVLEGDWTAHRVVVLEFPTVEQAKAFYHSADYASARERRLGASNFTMMVVAGETMDIAAAS
jgi:uncharacterized protein (DUF1330 family)